MTSFIYFSVYRQSFTNLLTYNQLLLKMYQVLMENSCPEMINMERNHKHLKTYKSFLFEVIQEVSSIYHSLKNAKNQFDFYLNHILRQAITIEKPCTTLD